MSGPGVVTAHVIVDKWLQLRLKVWSKHAPLHPPVAPSILTQRVHVVTSETSFFCISAYKVNTSCKRSILLSASWMLNNYIHTLYRTWKEISIAAITHISKSIHLELMSFSVKPQVHTLYVRNSHNKNNMYMCRILIMKARKGNQNACFYEILKLHKHICGNRIL